MKQNAWNLETEIVRPFSRDRLVGLDNDEIMKFIPFITKDPKSTLIFDIVNRKIQILFHIEKRIADDEYKHHPAEEWVGEHEDTLARPPDPCRSYIYDRSQPRKWLTGSLTLDIRRI